VRAFVVVAVQMFRFRSSRLLFRFLEQSVLSGLVLLCVSSFASATPLEESEPERARYSADDTRSLRFTPLNLTGGSKLTLISPTKWSDVADELVTTLNKTHAEYTARFASIPAFSTSIRLMDEQSFYELTGAPAWTNAMFIRGQIVIPISTTQPIELENLHRSVKHEYTHAIISALSGGRAPGWLDEGLAQLMEGDEHPALRASLKSWLQVNDPVPLSLLQGGFTKLSTPMVPPAYAQSLLASKAIVDTYGFSKIGVYLEALRQGVDKDQAFTIGFGISPHVFEQKLASALKTWSAQHKGHG
jgi:hypothetical protein